MFKLDKVVAGKCQDDGDEQSQNGDDNNEDTRLPSFNYQEVYPSYYPLAQMNGSL